MLLQFELVRPPIFDCVSQTVQRADARIATPGKNQLGDASHTNELIVNKVRRHPDQREPLASLTDNLVARSMGDKMSETLKRDGVAVANG